MTHYDVIRFNVFPRSKLWTDDDEINGIFYWQRNFTIVIIIIIVVVLVIRTRTLKALSLISMF